MKQKVLEFLYRNFDKVLHFSAGMFLSLFVVLSYWFVLLPLVVGGLKELADYVMHKQFDITDWFWTFVGSLPIMLLLLLKFVL